MYKVLPRFARKKDKMYYISNLYAFDFYENKYHSFEFKFKDNLKMIELSKISNKSNVHTRNYINVIATGKVTCYYDILPIVKKLLAFLSHRRTYFNLTISYNLDFFILGYFYFIEKTRKIHAQFIA